jgi:hypothetical protein
LDYRNGGTGNGNRRIRIRFACADE